MIVTVTMNPAIDKTVDIDALERGGLNRIQHVELDAGGKGINVSKTIHALGGKSVATGFIAGNAGNIIRGVLDQWQITNDFIEVSGETRTNTKVFEKSGELTELNEPGPTVEEEDIKALLHKLEGYADQDTLFVLAGSVPQGVPKDIYCKITELVHQRGAKVLLDADGELFTKALKAVPDIIKPNRVELEQYAGMDYIASEQELLSAAEKLMEKLGLTMEDVRMLQKEAHVGGKKTAGLSRKIKDEKKLALELGIGELTLQDIVKELEKPARDPREDMPAPILRSDVMDLEDLKPGMILKGTVRNIVDFGAFVDIGVHQDGLVHISQMTDRFIRHPLEAVSVGDIVDVQVLSVDAAKKRIALTMKISGK